MPETSILFFKDDQISRVVTASIATRVVQQHKSKQGCHFRRNLWFHQAPNQASQANRFRAKIGSHQRPTSRGGVPFIEYQIDSGQDRIEPFRHVFGFRYDIRNASVSNFAFRAHQSLRHRRHGHQESARDLVCLEPAKGPKCERNLSIKRERWMAARENQLATGRREFRWCRSSVPRFRTMPDFAYVSSFSSNRTLRRIRSIALFRAV